MNQATKTSQVAQLIVSGYNLWPGVRVTTIKGEIDNDHEGAERKTPAGSVGWINSVNDDPSGITYNVLFDNGAWVILDRSELDDATQYKIAAPDGPLHLALYIKYGFANECTMHDEGMFLAVEDLVNSHDAIIQLVNPDLL
jgi:hypothetical protein